MHILLVGVIVAQAQKLHRLREVGLLFVASAEGGGLQTSNDIHQIPTPYTPGTNSVALREVYGVLTCKSRCHN